MLPWKQQGNNAILDKIKIQKHVGYEVESKLVKKVETLFALLPLKCDDFLLFLEHISLLM